MSAYCRYVVYHNAVIVYLAVIQCKQIGYYADMTWVERSSKASADNYHAEILGGVGAQLLIKAAVAG
jgi:hypothetical protein